MSDTGNQSTFVLTSAGAVGTAKMINPGEETIEALEDSDLSTTNQKTFQPDDLSDPGEGTMTYFMDTAATQIAVGAVDTLTITYPQRTGETAPATEAGTVIITGNQKPTLANGQLQEGELKFKWDGNTERTFTPATTS